MGQPRAAAREARPPGPAGIRVALRGIVRLWTLAPLALLLFPGCSALVGPDVGRLGDGGPDGLDASIATSDAAVVRPDGGACPGTTIACGGRCVDPASDPESCGGCGRACGAEQTCVSGVCVCPAGAPACAPPLGDPDRCGGRSCRADQICAGDRCACRPGLTAVGDRCVDLASDPMNCGAVGTTCPEVCAGGTCRPRCPDGSTECDGACVHLASDPLSCGECGRRCDRDQICVGGRCRDYRPASSCDACGGDAPMCCDYARSTICVAASSCP